MSIQGMLDNEALNMMPLIVQAIKNADPFGADQIKYSAIREISNFTKPLVEMTDEEVHEKSKEMIDKYIFKGWIQKND